MTVPVFAEPPDPVSTDALDGIAGADRPLLRVAMVSMHTSPLLQPGVGDSGGMNVYVRELVSALAQSGVDCDVYVRRWDPDLPDLVEVEPGFRVWHLDAGPPALAKEDLASVLPAFTDALRAALDRRPVDLIHANYWLSAEAAHPIKHELDLPMVCTFHTLARVKAEMGDDEPQRRIDAEHRVVACSDALVANAQAELEQLVTLYDAPIDRVEIVPPGVLHAFFSPGDSRGARRAVELPAGPLLLFVGRIQPLKGVDVAVRTLAELGRPDATLVIVGGASGVDGPAEIERVRSLAVELEVADQVRFVEPQPHHTLASYYRAADVCLVPSRSESFGLVALEAAACGIPVVASAVGGLLTLVQHGRTGYLVENRDPAEFASYVTRIIDDPGLATELAVGAVDLARRYTWSATVGRLRRLYVELSHRIPVDCGAVR